MLLYARTEEAIQPNQTYFMSGNKIGVRTLDLNLHFTEIAAQLHGIVTEFFGQQSPSSVVDHLNPSGY
jgi:5-methylcytosine-specific restriction enzyme subunit McrC